MITSQPSHELLKPGIFTQRFKVWINFEQAIARQTHRCTSFEFMDSFVRLPTQSVGRRTSVPGVVGVCHAMAALGRFTGKCLSTLMVPFYSSDNGCHTENERLCGECLPGLVDCRSRLFEPSSV